MAIHLLKDEKIKWKSYPGKKYRTFLFATQFGVALVAFILLLYLNKEIGLSDIIGEKTIGFLSIAILVVGGLYAGYNQFMLLFIQYFITTDRIIIKKGFLNRKLTSIKHENIHDIKVEQTFAERLIATGHVYIFTANDSGITEDSHLTNVPSFQNIDDPFQIHQILEQAVEENSKQ